MINQYQITLPFASISGKKVKADFTGGVLTSDAGVLFLREVEKKMGVIKRFAEVLADRRHQSYIDHSYEELLSQRIYQIACGYEDANDCNDLRTDPAIKSACDRLPITGAALASQPTMTRLENSISRTDLYRIGRVLVDVFLDSYSKPPEEIVLDVDDTDSPTHGAQQMSLFNAYYDQYCFQPLHIYEGRSGKLLTTILRPGKRPSGVETRSMLKHLAGYIRESWPEVTVFIRGDSHFSTPELHNWADQNDFLFALGQAANPVLKEKAADLLQRARESYQRGGNKVRLFGEFEYQAESWEAPRRVICKAEVSSRGDNLRFVTVNFESLRPSVVYDTIYCKRGRMENFIKNHKNFLHSDRTSCHSFKANQFRLFLHSAAYILLHALAEKGLRGSKWAKAQFNTIQNRILKVGARAIEMVTRVRFHLPTSFPLKKLFEKILFNLATAFP
ncbi:MAG: IS1380 family transposase [Candidatus Krumholzibacteriota bacterium]